MDSIATKVFPNDLAGFFGGFPFRPLNNQSIVGRCREMGGAGDHSWIDEYSKVRKCHSASRSVWSGGLTASVAPPTQDELDAAYVPFELRDSCTHLLLPLNMCRQDNRFVPWKCTQLRHAYEKCQYEEYDPHSLAAIHGILTSSR